MNHGWCHDVARDAAVRAAEDGRTGPMPTLGEAIAAVTETMSGNRKGEEMEQGNFADAAERSVEMSKTGDGQSGMRTERVTLEITRPAIANYPAPAEQFMWKHLLRDVVQGERESVRVVSDEERELPPTTKPATTENDYVPPAPVSRPAKTRQTQAERVGGGWWFPKYDQPCVAPAPPPAPPRVHRGSGVFDANGDEVPWQGVVATLTEERDAAIRERDALRASVITQSLTADRFASAVQEADSLRARVAELEAASGGGEQPRGWLTEEEREVIAGIAGDDEYTEEGQNIAKGLLARSSPPEVALPEADCSWCSDYATVWRECLDAVRLSLAAAGVAWKEGGNG